MVGIFIGAVIGGGARVFIKDGGVWNPMKNIPDAMNQAREEGLKKGYSVEFNNPRDLELR
jgi:hypothetical protein